MLSNQELIDRFFEAYQAREMETLEALMHEEITWSFKGNHPLAGVRKGIREVVAFFDAMNKIMEQSDPKVEKLIICEDGKHIIECQHVRTNRADGNNIDHHVCVLWTFTDGMIFSGMHFFADPAAADKFFTAVTEIKAF